MAKKLRKEIAPERREQFVDATCSVIDKVGLADATLGQIAGSLGISAGLVSHYFGDKQNLLYATMRKMMNDLKTTTLELQKNVAPKDYLALIKTIIDSNFHTSQNSRAIIRTWLNFWVASLYDDELRRLQRVNERILISSLFKLFSKILGVEKAKYAARGLASMIDGLWLHLALSSDFNFKEAQYLAHQYVDNFILQHKNESVKG